MKSREGIQIKKNVRVYKSDVQGKKSFREEKISQNIQQINILIQNERIEEAFGFIDFLLNENVKRSNVDFDQIINDLVEKINETAIVLLKKKMYDQSYKVLKKCENLTQPC